MNYSLATLNFCILLDIRKSIGKYNHDKEESRRRCEVMIERSKKRFGLQIGEIVDEHFSTAHNTVKADGLCESLDSLHK